MKAEIKNIFQTILFLFCLLPVWVDAADYMAGLLVHRLIELLLMAAQEAICCLRTLMEEESTLPSQIRTRTWMLRLLLLQAVWVKPGLV